MSLIVVPWNNGQLRVGAADPQLIKVRLTLRNCRTCRCGVLSPFFAGFSSLLLGVLGLNRGKTCCSKMDLGVI